MLQIIAWLRTVEQLAHRLYAEASLLFKDDEAFSAFLRDLAEDEEWHDRLLDSAAQYLREHEVVMSPDIVVDATARERIEVPLVQARDLVGQGAITKAEMVELAIDVESSELNEVFIYVLDMLRQCDPTFEQGAAVIQTHQDRIRSFVATLPEAQQPAKDPAALPSVWERKYLVVDDSSPVRELLRRYLDMVGIAEAVASAEEGLDRLAEHYYDVVVTDVEMPRMDGIEFYYRAVARDPEIGQRFLFCSGLLSEQRETFFLEHGLSFVAKPFRLAQIGQMVQAIVARSNLPQNLGTASPEVECD